MPHHSSDPFPITPELLKELGVGATGRFPKGKLTKSDEGELCFLVHGEHGKVIITFGKQVSWLGLDPSDAVALAGVLIKHAREQSAEPITINLT